MKQVVQHLGSGDTILIDVPVPEVDDGLALVETRATVVSAGTERMLVEFGRSNLLNKVRQQPDKVRQVVDKIRTDGLGPTLDAVKAKLAQPIPMGYCQAGVVVAVGQGVGAFRPGDRVVTNGPHAEYVRVPHLLAARIPDGVSFEAAAFAPVAAIGLQGMRLAQPTLGETFVVFGLGLIGLLTVDILQAQGCRVVGVDRDPARLALAEEAGALVVDGTEGNVVQQVLGHTQGVGADGVLLTLASTSDEPISQAAEMSRKRGRLVLVGVTGLQLSRDAFYKKELSFQVSCSYGPGRYDPAYEERGADYPLAYVRWTEQRNFEAVLELMRAGRLSPGRLITHRYDFAEAPRAYDAIRDGGSALGVVLRYPDRSGVVPEARARTLVLEDEAERSPSPVDTPGVAVIGAGNFAVRTLLPALAETRSTLRVIASGGGTSAALAGRKFRAERVTSDVDAAIRSPDVDVVFILTRHDSHADLAIRALEAGKHVFVEKPLALTDQELERVAAAAGSADGLLMVGFNRRFAPLTTALRGDLAGRAGPLSLVITVNAGSIPREHWTQDPGAGGGRIVGEACHFLDLARYLAGSPISAVTTRAATGSNGSPVDDVAHLLVTFTDGSTAVINYLATGARSYPKERIECFFDGRTLVVDNWRRLSRFGVPGRRTVRGGSMDKGHGQEMRAWFDALAAGGPAPIPLTELVEVSRWAIRAADQARSPGS